MSSIRLQGTSSGYYDLTVPAAAGTNSIDLSTLPSKTNLGTSSITHGSNTGDTRFTLNSANQYTLRIQNAGNIAGQIGGGGADDLRFSNAAGATTMQIKDGRVTTPDQPGFFAKRTIGGDGRSSGVITEWQIAGAGTFNTGNHFNTSTGTFTAPIAGKYLFTAAPGYKQTNIEWNFHFEINGTNNSEAVRFIGTPLNSHSTATGTVIYNLSANDTIRIHTSYTHHVNTDKNFFMGYLLG